MGGYVDAPFKNTGGKCVLLSMVNFLSASAVETFSSGMENLASDAPMSERLLYGLEIAAIGMIVVFLILMILWAVLKIFGAVFGSKRAAAPKAEQTAASAPAAAAAPKPASSGLDEEKLVAVATAAIAAMRGEEKCAFKVISITKIKK